MNYATDEDKELSTSNKPGNKCYGCGLPIFFTSKKEETPSGKPTKDPLTGKVIPLDISSNEQHVCKPEDIEAFKQTDERKKRTEEWLSTQKSGQEVIASCLVRIPGSFNAKCLEAGRGLEESKVNIVQKWNGIAPKMPLEMLTDLFL